VHDVNRKKIAMQLEAQHPLSTVQYLPGSDKHIVCTSTNGYIYVYDLRKSNKPIYDTYIANCILNLDIHATLKYSAIRKAMMTKEEEEENPQGTEEEEEQKVELRVETETETRERVESPISSAVARLPSIHDLNKTFESIYIKSSHANSAEIMTRNVNVKESKNDVVNSNEKEMQIECGNEMKSKINRESESESKDESMKETRILTEAKVREIVREEVMRSEKRMLSEVAKMMNQVHLDLIEQFVHNEMSTEKHIQSLMDLIKNCWQK